MTDDTDTRDGEAIRVGRCGPGESVSVSVATALAELLDADTVSIDLHKHVDTEALDRLFEPLRDGTSREGRVTFRAAGYDVTAWSDGRYEIAPASE